MNIFPNFTQVDIPPKTSPDPDSDPGAVAKSENGDAMGYPDFMALFAGADENEDQSTAMDNKTDGHPDLIAELTAGVVSSTSSDRVENPESQTLEAQISELQISELQISESQIFGADSSGPHISEPISQYAEIFIPTTGADSDPDLPPIPGDMAAQFSGNQSTIIGLSPQTDNVTLVQAPYQTAEIVTDAGKIGNGASMANPSQGTATIDATAGLIPDDSIAHPAVKFETTTISHGEFSLTAKRAEAITVNGIDAVTVRPGQRSSEAIVGDKTTMPVTDIKTSTLSTSGNNILAPLARPANNAPIIVANPIPTSEKVVAAFIETPSTSEAGTVLKTQNPDAGNMLSRSNPSTDGHDQPLRDPRLVIPVNPPSFTETDVLTSRVTTVTGLSREQLVTINPDSHEPATPLKPNLDRSPDTKITVPTTVSPETGSADKAAFQASREILTSEVNARSEPVLKQSPKQIENNNAPVTNLRNPGSESFDASQFEKAVRKSDKSIPALSSDENIKTSADGPDAGMRSAMPRESAVASKVSAHAAPAQGAVTPIDEPPGPRRSQAENISEEPAIKIRSQAQDKSALPAIDDVIKSAANAGSGGGAKTVAELSVQTGIVPITGSDTAFKAAQTVSLATPTLSSHPAIQAVAQTLVKAQETQNGVVVRLDPPELGRVFIDFHFETERGLTAVIRSEVAETAILLKDKADIFHQVLKDSGFDSINLNFEQNGDSKQKESYFERQEHMSALFNVDEENEDKTPDSKSRAVIPSQVGSDQQIDIKI